MAEYFSLAQDDRRDLLLAAADAIARSPALVEKDIWVVWALGSLFDSAWKEHLVFKGGTSLSKVYRLIDRFSEDIDVTYDIRQLVPGLGQRNADPVPASRTEADRWTRQARAALAQWVAGDVVPALGPAAIALGATVRQEGADVYVDYPSVLENDAGYMRTGVKIEFGGRATGEPAEWADIHCDAAASDELARYFPVARVNVMRAERTFWEKATAAHVFCLQEKSPCERFARHWFDLACMFRAGTAESAVAEVEIARTVADHKAMFFRMKAADDTVVDYAKAVAGGLRLIPSRSATERLRADYDAMVEGGFLGAWQPGFDEVLRDCEEIEALANASANP